MNTNKDEILERYMNLPYSIEVTPSESEDYSGYVARIIELPGCLTQVKNLDELGINIKEAMRLWLEIAIEKGLQIPEPGDLSDYSGKFVVRTPKSLHKDLVDLAQRENVSLNSCINNILSQAIGRSDSNVIANTKSNDLIPISEGSGDLFSQLFRSYTDEIINSDIHERSSMAVLRHLDKQK